MRSLHTLTRSLLIAYVAILLVGVGAITASLKLEHFKLLRVQTSSMVPTFRPGAMIVVRPTRMANIQVGDVITFVNPASGQTVSHRVVALNRASAELTTKGDNVTKTDTPIRQSAVIGKVTEVLPYAGNVLAFVQRPLGLAIFLYVPALAVVWNECKTLASHYRKGYYRLLSFR